MATSTAEGCYSPRLDEALALVTRAFRARRRKGTGIPYLTHLLQVMVTVAENGGDEELLIAGLLHDYLEDIEGTTAEQVSAQFGDRVARIVTALSDSTTHPKPPWEQRKREFIEAIAREPEEVRLVCAADKLHNARSIRRDFEAIGETVWDRFKASRDETLWYYREIVFALGTGWDHPLLAELRAEVTALHEAVGVAYEAPQPRT